MFDFLKKKISDFVGTITRKEEKVAEEQIKPAEETKPIEPAISEKTKSTETKTAIETQPIESAPTSEKQIIGEEIKAPVPEPKAEPESLKEETASKLLEEVETQKKIELGKPVAKAYEDTIISETAEEKIIEKVEKVEPLQPEKIASQKEKEEAKRGVEAKRVGEASPGGVEQKVHEEKIGVERQIHKKEDEIHEQIVAHRLETGIRGEDVEEKEIEELVGETVEGEIKREAREAERKIVEEKNKEEIAQKVFHTQKEEFLAHGKERDLKPKVGIFSQIKGFFTGEVEIKESDTNELFDQFEMALLESDVSYPTAQALIFDLKKRLVGRRVKTGRIQEEVKREIAYALASVLQTSKSDFIEKIQHAKNSSQIPFIVLFIGPNGMGKTTTIAKVAYNLKGRGLSSVISASDTFRAAAIEQAEHHGTKLGIRVIKHKYGADPAAVAFDAINYAKAHEIDAVLIDTAGRQDTNANLLSEMQKIVRVVKPNLKVFIAEAIAGSSLVNQVKTFNEKLGVDGIILTKLDCDAKGGGSLSIAYECKLPVYFVGTGQEYGDLLEFNEEWIVKNIMAE